MRQPVNLSIVTNILCYANTAFTQVRVMTRRLTCCDLISERFQSWLMLHMSQCQCLGCHNIPFLPIMLLRDLCTTGWVYVVQAGTSSSLINFATDAASHASGLLHPNCWTIMDWLQSHRTIFLVNHIKYWVYQCIDAMSTLWVMPSQDLSGHENNETHPLVTARGLQHLNVWSSLNINCTPNAHSRLLGVQLIYRRCGTCGFTLLSQNWP